MGLLDILWAPRYAAAVKAAEEVQASFTGTNDPSTYPIASPWSSSNLERIVFEDIFGSETPSNTRAAAMRIPAVARARNLLVSTICGLPLVARRRGDLLPDQPSWLSAPAAGASPQHRLAWTVDDLIFYGWSCWWRRNGADGFPLVAGRINQGEWTINADNRVEVHGQVVDDNDVILISGLHEGILSFGRDTLSDAATLLRTVRARIENPAPQFELHQVEGRDLTREEIDLMITDWAAARAGKNGGVGYTSKHIETKEHGASADAQLMIEARNASAVDIARLVGITASLIDATAPKASLNYETTTGRNHEFIDRDLALYMAPITARLSLDDCTPHGTNIAFDTNELTVADPSPTGPALED